MTDYAGEQAMELEALEVRRHAWAAHNTRREGDMAVGGE